MTPLPKGEGCDGETREERRESGALRLLPEGRGEVGHYGIDPTTISR